MRAALYVCGVGAVWEKMFIHVSPFSPFFLFFIWSLEIAFHYVMKALMGNQSQLAAISLDPAEKRIRNLPLVLFFLSLFPFWKVIQHTRMYTHITYRTHRDIYTTYYTYILPHSCSERGSNHSSHFWRTNSEGEAKEEVEEGKIHINNKRERERENKMLFSLLYRSVWMWDTVHTHTCTHSKREGRRRLGATSTTSTGE